MPNVMTIMRLARCKFGCHVKVYKAPAKVPTAIATGPAKPKIHIKRRNSEKKKGGEEETE